MKEPNPQELRKLIDMKEAPKEIKATISVIKAPIELWITQGSLEDLDELTPELDIPVCIEPYDKNIDSIKYLSEHHVNQLLSAKDKEIEALRKEVEGLKIVMNKIQIATENGFITGSIEYDFQSKGIKHIVAVEPIEVKAGERYYSEFVEGKLYLRKL